MRRRGGRGSGGRRPPSVRPASGQSKSPWDNCTQKYQVKRIHNNSIKQLSCLLFGVFISNFRYYKWKLESMSRKIQTICYMPNLEQVASVAKFCCNWFYLFEWFLNCLYFPKTFLSFGHSETSYARARTSYWNRSWSLRKMFLYDRKRRVMYLRKHGVPC